MAESEESVKRYYFNELEEEEEEEYVEVIFKDRNLVFATNSNFPISISTVHIYLRCLLIRR